MKKSRLKSESGALWPNRAVRNQFFRSMLACTVLLGAFEIQATASRPSGDDQVSLLSEVAPPNLLVTETGVIEHIDRIQSLFTVTGLVVDDHNQPIPGVNVLEKGTTNGTTTDVDGKFFLSVKDESSLLVFSFIGYVSQELSVNSRSTINVTLAQDVQSLDEVVVIGYGVQKKTSVTAAVSTLKGTEIASTPTTNLSNSFGGRVSGVIVKQSTGEPGSDGSSIFIRGISSTGATQPLIIVDGIPRDFTQLDPNTIESFTILKDAAAVAPYGVAGAKYDGAVFATIA